MNKKQKIILIAGAIIFFIAVITTPKIIYIKGCAFKPTQSLLEDYQSVASVGTAAVRALAIGGGMALLFFAFRERK